MTDNFVIDVLGGMGTYATIHLFNQYACVFGAEKEWDRPRIIIDNRCTMPSRVRAWLYDENTEELISQMSESLKLLIDAKCTRIILACNTSHLFLPAIYEDIPEAVDIVYSIIDCCVERIVLEKVKSVYLLASEGTIESNIYQRKLADRGIACITPNKEDYRLLRKCIEAVKQCRYSEEIKSLFLELIERYDTCILGCTELPVLYEKYVSSASHKKVYDPLLITLQELKKEFDDD